MDKEVTTVINSLLANKKLTDDLVDFLTNENQKLREQAHYHYENGLKKDVEIERLREALKNIACVNPSATNSSYVMRDVALTALQQKEGE